MNYLDFYVIGNRMFPKCLRYVRIFIDLRNRIGLFVKFKKTYEELNMLCPSVSMSKFSKLKGSRWKIF